MDCSCACKDKKTMFVDIFRDSGIPIRQIRPSEAMEEILQVLTSDSIILRADPEQVTDAIEAAEALKVMLLSEEEGCA